MAKSINELVTPLVKDDVLKDLYTLLGMFGLTTTALQPGEPIPVALSVFVSWFVDKVWNPLVIPALRAPFLDYATGDWLALIAWLVYNRPPIVATGGTAPLDVENRSTISGTVAIGVGKIRFRNKVTGKTYTNTTAATVAQWGGSGAFPIAAPTMIFQADEAGIGSNANPGDIAPFPATPQTAPSVGLYYTNVAPVTTSPPIYGSDAETDASIVTRCRAAVGDLSPGGPRLAYVSVALDPRGAFTRRGLTVPPQWTSTPSITRVRIQEPGAAVVNVFLASASGPAAGSDTDPASDVGMASVAIQMFVVPPGELCTVAAAVTQNLALGVITLDVAAESLVTTDDAASTATAALEAYFAVLPIGGAKNVGGSQGYVFRNALAAVAGKGPGVVTVDLPYFTNLSIDKQPVGGNAVVVPSFTVAVNIVPQGA